MDIFFFLCMIGLSVGYLSYRVVRWFYLRQQQDNEQLFAEDKTGLLFLVVGPLARIFRTTDSEFVREKLDEYRRLLATAGRFMGGFDEAEVLSAQFTFAILFPLLFWVSGAAALMGAIGLLAMLVLCVLGYAFPYSRLKAQAEERQKQFFRQFPNALDTLTIAVEAGLDFRASVSYLSSIFVKGPVREEFSLFLADLRVGRPASESLSQLGQRMNITEVSAVLSTVVQSLEMGTSVGRILRDCASEMRRKRLLAAKEEANKAVVKMTLPMVLLILPCIFIVLLGPVAVSFMTSNLFHR